MDLSAAAPGCSTLTTELSAEGEVIFEGMLKKMKQGKNWKSRHCSIVQGEGSPVFVYRKKAGGKVCGILPLKGAWLSHKEDSKVKSAGDQKAAFQVMPSRNGDKVYFFQAGGEGEKRAWIDALTSMVCINAPLEEDELATLGIDATSLSAEELMANCNALATTLRIPQLLGKTAEDLEGYFAACRDQMNDVPFHSWNHVADVLQFLFSLLRTSGLATLLSPMQLVGIVLATIAHDLEHRGRSNDYERNEETDIGVKYPAAPLETHHATLALATLDSTSILSELSEESATVVRECVHSCIMSTDMSRHKDIISEFKGAEAELMGDTHTASDFFSHGPKGMLLLGMMIKLSDISNVARPIEIAHKWNAMVYEEFYAEGDVDREKGRPINALMNRETNNIPKSTVGFINFVVKPVAEELLKFLEAASLGPDAPGADIEGIRAIVNSLAENAKRHDGLASAEAAVMAVTAAAAEDDG